MSPLPMVDLRPPDQVMRLERMGSFHQSRLSFMRTLLRRMKNEQWTFGRPVFDIDADGVGTALYTASTPERTYTLVAFGHDLPDDQRSDRVIATAWDATFTLHDGIPTDDDVARLRANVPLQEAGRVGESELTLSRANRSVRLWSHVVDALAAGHQPDRELVDSVGYLMRTTAVYGSGKFGAADRQVVAERDEFIPPFQVEMLTVYLIRTFVLDLVEHVAALRSDHAVTLDPDMRRSLGIGNSTGLGMAPFLLAHPLLINNWIAARETALARVRSIAAPEPHRVERFLGYVERAHRTVDLWNSEHPLQQAKVSGLENDLALLDARLDAHPVTNANGWDELIDWAHEALTIEGQELLVSLVLEPHGDLVDDLAYTMHADEAAAFRIDGSVTVAETRRQIEDVYGWARSIAWRSPEANARAWYVSEEKLEPRLGERHEEPIADFEQPLQPARDAMWMEHDLADADADASLGSFLRMHPEHRHIARRLQVAAAAPYAEIRDNTIDAAMLPIDLLRAKLSFFGATHFDPRSDRWVRINMFRGAPFPAELADCDADDWTYPTVAVS